MKGRGLLAEEVPGGIVASRSLWHLAIGLGLDGVDEVGELDRILNEEDGNVVPHDIEVALVGVAKQLLAIILRSRFDCSQVPYNLVANPWTSRTVSALPREPATVENRMKMGVSLPSPPRNEAAVMLL